MSAVIIAAARTGIGNFGGSLAKVPAPALGSAVIQAVLKRGGVDAAKVDEVIMGNVLTSGLGQNPARQAAMGAGIPQEVPSMTIDKVCGSGLKSVMLAAQAIKCGDASLVVAGGQENMSSTAHVLEGSRDGMRMGEWKMKDTMIADGLTCAFNKYHMGITAENIVEKYGLSRTDQDAFAASSQQKAEAANKQGWFKEEIAPVTIPQRKGDPIVFETDEYIKSGVTAEKLSKMRAAFKKDGTVTAGNASGINDGAAAVLVASEDYANANGSPILAKIIAYASAGVDPKIMGMGPVPAVQKCLEKAGWSLAEVDIIEANEAFAAQSLGVTKELGLDTSKVNICGGAIAVGHPIGASGCRVLVTLVHQMQRTGAKKGLATLCIGGGQGVAIAIERP